MYGSRWTLTIDIQGHWQPGFSSRWLSSLLGQLAIKHGRTSGFPVLVCMWRSDTKHTDTHSYILWLRFLLSQSDSQAPARSQRE